MTWSANSPVFRHEWASAAGIPANTARLFGQPPTSILAGLLASLVLTRLLQVQLFDVRPPDTATVAAVTLCITAGALVACCIPAARATRVDPIVVLRNE